MNPKKTNNSKYTIDRKRNVCDILVEGNDSLNTVLDRYNDILNDEEWRCGKKSPGRGFFSWSVLLLK